MNRFTSLRWSVLLPLFGIILLVLMVGVYVLVSRLPADSSAVQTTILVNSGQGLSRSASQYHEAQITLAQRVASDNQTTAALLEGWAQAGEADIVALLDSQGIERLTVYRQADGFQQRAGTNLGISPGRNETMTGLVQAGSEWLVYSAVPVLSDGRVVGAALVGHRLATVLATSDTAIDIALWAVNGRLVYSDAPDTSAITADTPSLMVNRRPYIQLRTPFEFGGRVLGVLQLLMPATMGSGLSQQALALVLAAVAAAALIGVFLVFGRMLARLEKIRSTVEALAAGQTMMRTGLHPRDEIGAVGHAIDQFAGSVQEHQDLLRRDLRRQRREVTHLLSVLEALPYGVIVLDVDSHVTLVNRLACELLGSQQAFQDGNTETLTALAADMLGPALAPGIYALGSPYQFETGHRILNAHSAAVMTHAGQRVGTVVTLTDVTQEARRERARERLLTQIAEQTQPLFDADPMRDLVREMNRQAVALQKLVLELRTLNNANLAALPDSETRPLLLDSLVWSLANEWRQVAEAGNLTLHVIIEQAGLYVQGSERRLRWALGNLIDNAIKYTPPGGDLTIEIQADTSDDEARIRIRDNGAGISEADLPHIFQRFYRGQPVTAEGRLLEVAGAGQGLYTARQIIETQGGSLKIRSKQGVGTAAYIHLPLAPQPSLAEVVGALAVE